MTLAWLPAAAALCLLGCSQPSAPQPNGAAGAQTPHVVPASSNPVAKYIEIVGVRINEKSPGKLRIQIGVVNHSEADVGDVTLAVDLRATAQKAADPPLVSFTCTAPALGPEDLKQVTVEVPSKLRAYELPDWQFLKADFRVIEPK